MLKSVIVVLLPAIALSGCTLLGGGKSVESGELGVRRNAPLVIPPNFTLPPPTRTAAPAPGR